MIGARDRLELPAGVQLAGDGLDDSVRGITVPLNETGRTVIVAGSVAEMAELATCRFGIDRPRALADARVFALHLNRHHLLNVRVRGGPLVAAVRWFSAATVLARHGRLPTWLARRRALPPSTARAVWSTAVGAFPAGLGGAAIAVFAPVAVGLPLDFALAALLSLAIGVSVHEAGHVLLLRGAPAFVARRGVRLSVVHGRLPSRHESFVALGGVLAGSAYAIAAAALAWAIAAPQLSAAVAALVPHAFALTVVTGDGRRACAGF